MGPIRQRDARIAEIAARQQGLVTFGQLRALGLSRNSITHRRRTGRLHPARYGVHSLLPPPLSRNTDRLAAVLSCGPGALLSHLPSALLQGFAREGSEFAHVTTTRSSGRTRRDLVVHRSLVDPRDVRRVDSIPCTSADRTLADLAATMEAHELEVLMVAAESIGLLKRHRLAELVAERYGRPGISKLAGLLRLEPRLARSELELLFDPIWRGAGLRRPRFNHLVVGLEVDVAWPELRMAVELDSQRLPRRLGFGGAGSRPRPAAGPGRLGLPSLRPQGRRRTPFRNCQASRGPGPPTSARRNLSPSSPRRRRPVR